MPRARLRSTSTLVRSSIDIAHMTRTLLKEEVGIFKPGHYRDEGRDKLYWEAQDLLGTGAVKPVDFLFRATNRERGSIGVPVTLPLTISISTTLEVEEVAWMGLRQTLTTCFN